MSESVPHDAELDVMNDGMCKCGKNPSTEPHQCPFQIEIYERDDLCTCCSECTDDCAMDI